MYMQYSNILSEASSLSSYLMDHFLFWMCIKVKISNPKMSERKPEKQCWKWACRLQSSLPFKYPWLWGRYDSTVTRVSAALSLVVLGKVGKWNISTHISSVQSVWDGRWTNHKLCATCILRVWEQLPPLTKDLEVKPKCCVSYSSCCTRSLSSSSPGRASATLRSASLLTDIPHVHVAATHKDNRHQSNSIAGSQIWNTNINLLNLQLDVFRQIVLYDIVHTQLTLNFEWPIFRTIVMCEMLFLACMFTSSLYGTF